MSDGRQDLDFAMYSALALESAGFDRGFIRAHFERLRAGNALQINTESSENDQTMTRFRPDRAPRTEGFSSDGTTRFVTSLERGRAVETVVIPSVKRSTVCVSVQVGCRRACVFCATGRMGLLANLSGSEILDQIAWSAQIARRRSLPPVRNVVFMGMGEPLDNARAVGRALALLTDPRGWAFAPRHITVSSVGPSPRAVGLARRWPGRIAWSLHAADDALRRELVPTATAGVEELARAFLSLVEARRQPLFVEMTLIDGLNDEDPHADAAARLFAGRERQVRFNLLPVNVTASGHRPSPIARVQAFRDRLRARGFFAMIRRARGSDERAACGQLLTLPGR